MEYAETTGTMEGTLAQYFTDIEATVTDVDWTSAIHRLAMGALFSGLAFFACQPFGATRDLGFIVAGTAGVSALAIDGIAGNEIRQFYQVSKGKWQQLRTIERSYLNDFAVSDMVQRGWWAIVLGVVVGAGMALWTKTSGHAPLVGATVAIGTFALAQMFTNQGRDRQDGPLLNDTLFPKPSSFALLDHLEEFERGFVGSGQLKSLARNTWWCVVLAGAGYGLLKCFPETRGIAEVTAVTTLVTLLAIQAMRLDSWEAREETTAAPTAEPTPTLIGRIRGHANEWQLAEYVEGIVRSYAWCAWATVTVWAISSWFHVDFNITAAASVLTLISTVGFELFNGEVGSVPFVIDESDCPQLECNEAAQTKIRELLADDNGKPLAGWKQIERLQAFDQTEVQNQLDNLIVSYDPVFFTVAQNIQQRCLAVREAINRATRDPRWYRGLTLEQGNALGQALEAFEAVPADLAEYNQSLPERMNVISIPESFHGEERQILETLVGPSGSPHKLDDVYFRLRDYAEHEVSQILSGLPETADQSDVVADLRSIRSATNRLNTAIEQIVADPDRRLGVQTTHASELIEAVRNFAFWEPRAEPYLDRPSVEEQAAAQRRRLDDAALNQWLEERYTIQPVDDNGDCLFLSVIAALAQHGIEIDHLILRGEVANRMQAVLEGRSGDASSQLVLNYSLQGALTGIDRRGLRGELATHIDDNNWLEAHGASAYVEQIRQTGSWGGEAEIAYISEYLRDEHRIELGVYSAPQENSAGERPEPRRQVGHSVPGGQQISIVHWASRSHYDGLGPRGSQDAVATNVVAPSGEEVT